MHVYILEMLKDRQYLLHYEYSNTDHHFLYIIILIGPRTSYQQPITMKYSQIVETVACMLISHTLKSICGFNYERNLKRQNSAQQLDEDGNISK
jgi:hypothetical protein